MDEGQQFMSLLDNNNQICYYYTLLFVYARMPCPPPRRDLLNKLGTSIFLGQGEVQGGKASELRTHLLVTPMTYLLGIKIFPKKSENK